MSGIEITQKQARRALLAHQGVWPPRSLRGMEGALTYMQRVGSIQFDPVDVAGISPEIALCARVRGFKRGHLDALLYKQRRLCDVWDKNACIALAEHHADLLENKEADWGWRPRVREADVTEALHAQLDRMLEEQEHISNAELLKQPLLKEILMRRLSQGEVGIHHRQGRERYYARSDRLLPQEYLVPVRRDETAHAHYFVKRRIGCIGLLWNRPSHAFLGVTRFSTALRQQAFADLERDGEILPVQVEGIKAPFYLRAEDQALLAAEDCPPRAAFLAPLDNLMWDRKLIETLFGFHYMWEIYTPAEKRVYGPYTLPVLYGDRFIARVQLRREEGALRIQNWWWEADVRPSKAMHSAIQTAFNAHAGMLGLEAAAIGAL